MLPVVTIGSVYFVAKHTTTDTASRNGILRTWLCAVNVSNDNRPQKPRPAPRLQQNESLLRSPFVRRLYRETASDNIEEHLMIKTFLSLCRAIIIHWL